ncbi:MAG: PEGA domain-containing protein [Terriglobia bacterium]|jgi:serine/threonine-protein kinase
MADAMAKAGRYQIVSELGRGSMGVVYHGFDPVIGRTVAIKTMLTEGLTSQEFREFKSRFQREAQAAGVLSHPNIVNVFDYGEDNGILYLIMEYLEGKSLEKLIEEQGMLPIETIIPMYDQVCGALDHAHQHDIVHRDIKPANIMILDNGLVKVTDFGIAKMMSMGMTQAGQVLGTPNYMSPEQVKGRQIDGRSDIFSLGIILYDLVTGEMPFGGQNITTVIYKIINENPIPPRELDATIHPGLSYVICKALAKNPDERYQTCRELADDLKNFKSLAGPASPSATVMVKVPPLSSTIVERAAAPPVEISRPPAAPTEAVQTTRIEQPSPGQVPGQVMPPPTTYPKPHLPPIVWILLTLGAIVLLGILGGAILYLHKVNSRVATPQVGQLLVAANVSGAKISVDGSSEPNWVTPYTISDLSVGSHQVVVSKEGYDDYRQSVTIEGGKPFTVNASLPARAEPLLQTPAIEPALAKVKPSKKGSDLTGAVTRTGQLLVRANVSGARISVDGSSEPNWITPYSPTIDLSAGTHQVVVSKEGYEDSQRSVTIEAGKTSTVSVPLSVGSGEVMVVTTPPGLEVLIDGKSIGLSPAHTAVIAGSHSYSVMRPGLTPYEGTVKVKSGAMPVIKVSMTRPGEGTTGIVDVRTIPVGATVLWDGNPVEGLTPTSFRLTPGRHTLVISLSGYRTVQQVIEVKADQPNPVDVRMSR